MTILYECCSSIDQDEFLDILKKSGLAERRPVDQPERIAQMIEHANLYITARDDGKLIGLSRSLTDFSFVCYLSELAVDREYQGQSVGRMLMKYTKEYAKCRTFLISAPAAVGYYRHCGLTQIDNVFELSS